MLSNHMVMWIDVVPILSKENSFSLTHALWLYYKHWIFLPSFILR